MRLKQKRRALLSRLNKVKDELYSIENDAEQIFETFHDDIWLSWPLNADSRLFDFVIDDIHMKLLELIEELE